MVAPGKCLESDTLTVMVPLEYPTYGREPVQADVKCVLDENHEGKHRAEDVVQADDVVEWE